ncbi:MAG: ASTRA complex subunit [Phylliscum demangeonii]|nr:MAG: ASTRA complex subunit [Phylliscum demangeonii]
MESPPPQTAPTQRLPVPQPSYILRGHVAAVHSLEFIRGNSRLLSGDADGWVVLWDTTSKRARAAWKAHGGGSSDDGDGNSNSDGDERDHTNAAVLRAAAWDGDKIITHGRDQHLRVWQVRPPSNDDDGDEAALSQALPAEARPRSHLRPRPRSHLRPRPRPWLLHALPVNTLNFCAFAMCPAGDDDDDDAKARSASATLRSTSVQLAVPSAADSDAIDILQLPSEQKLATLGADRAVKTGMVMALGMFRSGQQGRLSIVAGYESGHAMVYQHHDNDNNNNNNNNNDAPSWTLIYSSQAHSQPVLSLDLLPSAHAHAPAHAPAYAHAHSHGDYYFLTSSADAIIAQHHPMLREHHPPQRLNTKHAGQQALRVRSDGRIFATAGWDARVRVYATAVAAGPAPGSVMTELAVLKWHAGACLALAFAEIGHRRPTTPCTLLPAPSPPQSQLMTGMPPDADDEGARWRVGVGVGRPSTARGGAGGARRRAEQAASTHWLAAGGKDGKVSLWEMY